MLAPSPSLPPKPQGFRAAGKIRIASRVNMARRTPDHAPNKRFKEGLRYEGKAITHLQQEFGSIGGDLIVEPCFRFSNGHRSRFCFPDALLILPDPFDIVIEIKTRHTYDAWWQLRKLYEPVVRKAMQRELKLLEVVKSYDPGVRLPEEETRILESAADVINSTAPYNLYIWTGR